MVELKTLVPAADAICSNDFFQNKWRRSSYNALWCEIRRFQLFRHRIPLTITGKENWFLHNFRA
uniref:Uncharacterized protein n=1 Tax=Nelumbo nucifera TaxID=4432 RepID=A0A822XHA9_NELNU|nr:TPA_asm: hypothetical protein HUJ06_022327 [Nelumbo nucifera]